MLSRLLILVFLLPNMAFAYTITLTEEQIQTQVDEFMPIERKHLLATFVFSDPVIELISASNKIGLAIRLEVISPLGLKGSGDSTMLGTIDYKKETGQFFISDIEVTKLQVKNLPTKLSNELRKVFQAVLAGVLKRYPVYTLDQNDVKQKMTKSLLQSVVVKDHKLVIELSPF